jgi:PhnB protein
MAVREGFHTITPYLVTKDLDGLVEFAKRALGAEETLRGSGGGGGVHVELKIGDSMLMLGGANKSTTAMLYLYVEDPDAFYTRALEAGASSIMPPTDVVDGERRAGVSDAFGNQWFFGKPIAR